jgi:hypothetical protein
VIVPQAFASSIATPIRILSLQPIGGDSHIHFALIRLDKVRQREHCAVDQSGQNGAGRYETDQTRHCFSRKVLAMLFLPLCKMPRQMASGTPREPAIESGA